jgi:exodeoxyribonuclease-3
LNVRVESDVGMLALPLQLASMTWLVELDVSRNQLFEIGAHVFELEGLRVLNLYVPNGSSLQSEKYAYKLAWLACLRRYLAAQERQGEPLVMVGDFNIAPEDRDLHDPERLTGGIMASDAERQALCGVLGERLIDAFRLFESQAGHWSWWDYRTGAWERDRGWRIDHVYLDHDLQECATGCVIHRAVRGNEQPSDHAPVVVHLDWPPADDDEGEEF